MSFQTKNETLFENASTRVFSHFITYDLHNCNYTLFLSLRFTVSFHVI